MTPATRASPSARAPVQQAERIQVVDILRGFALFGILFVNTALFRLSLQTILLPPASGRFCRLA